jgi:two-component system, NtrC family, response regulator AtoC
MSEKPLEESPPSRPRLDSYPFSRPRVLAVWRSGFASAALPESGQLLVGRGLAAGLRIDSASVSREHALVLAGEPPSIVDRGSANGVHVDGVKLAPGVATPFGRDSIIELGDAFLMLDDSLAAPPAFGEEPRTSPPPPSAPASRVTRVDVLENAVERVRRLEPSGARLQRLADLIATTNLSVVVVGQRGSGRATLAKRMHRRSARARLPFLSIDCAALAGAGAAGLGLLRDAIGGSVLLENVSALPPAMQADLVAVLGQPRLLEAALAHRFLDVRLMTTTDTDLRVLVADGTFRLDLYLRLRGVQLKLRPLCERRAEILPLAHQFLVAAASRGGFTVPEIGPEARDHLERQPWPGNLPELRGVMERAVLRSRGERLAAWHVQGTADVEEENDDGPVTLEDTLPEPERPTNPYASNEPFGAD